MRAHVPLAQTGMPYLLNREGVVAGESIRLSTDADAGDRDGRRALSERVERLKSSRIAIQ